MTIGEARLHLYRMADATADPVVSDLELDEILALCRLPDDEGRRPDDPAWAGRWLLDLAAAMVWEAKAARVAGEFDFTADGMQMARSQMVERYEAMAQRFRRRIAGRLERW